MESLFKQYKKKQKQESPTASLSGALPPLLDAQSCSGVCSLRKGTGEAENIRERQKITHTAKVALKFSLVGS